MAAFNEDRDRQMIPRWRTFASSTEFGELNPLVRRDRTNFTADLLVDVLDDWSPRAHIVSRGRRSIGGRHYWLSSTSSRVCTFCFGTSPGTCGGAAR